MKIRPVIGAALLAFALSAAVWRASRPAPFRVPSQAALRQAFSAQSQAILEKSDSFELLSLSPDRNPEANLTSAPGHFHGWRILGRATLRPEQRKLLIAALYDSMAQASNKIAGCFNPRHGIHALKNGQSLDLIICFHCGNMEVYGPHGRSISTVTHNSQAAFDNLLRDANLPLAPS